MLIKQSYHTELKSDISLVVFSPDSEETNLGCGGKLNGHLIASCVRNIPTKNYQHLIIAFQVTVENVGGVLFGTQSIVIHIVQFSCFIHSYKSLCSPRIFLNKSLRRVIS